jgi:cell division protein FtsQ
MTPAETYPGFWRRRGSLVSLTLLLVLVGAASLGAYSWKRDLTVREVRARGMTLLSPPAILQLAAVPVGEKLFAVDPDQVRRRVEAQPFVRSASVTRDVPGVVTITVQERTPMAVLLTNRTVYVDENAFVLPALAQNRVLDLPFITGVTGATDCRPGQTMTAPALQQALDLLKEARMIGEDLYHNISEVSITPGGDIICTLAESGAPVLIGQGGYAEKLLKLDAFWKERVARQGLHNLQYIDLRFDDQVVARWIQGHELALQEGNTQ